MTHQFSQMLRELADILTRNPELPIPDITDQDGVVFQPADQQQMNAVVDVFGADWGDKPEAVKAVFDDQWVEYWIHPDLLDWYQMVLVFDPRVLQVRSAVVSA